MSRQRLPIRILGIALLSLTACTDGSGVYQVEGQLIVGDQPVRNAALAFHPVNVPKFPKVLPVGLTDPNGRFQLTTFANQDGAPAGDYIVTIIWRDDSIPIDECECEDPTKHDRFAGRYSDVGKSDLRVTIHPRQNEILLKTPAIPVDVHNKMPRPKSTYFLAHGQSFYHLISR